MLESVGFLNVSSIVENMRMRFPRLECPVFFITRSSSAGDSASLVAKKKKTAILQIIKTAIIAHIIKSIFGAMFFFWQ